MTIAMQAVSPETVMAVRRAKDTEEFIVDVWISGKRYGARDNDLARLLCAALRFLRRAGAPAATPRAAILCGSVARGERGAE